MSLRDKIERGRAALAAGVQVVSAPDLFPTPPDVAARMAEALELFHGCTVLEPSAGTGNLVRAVKEAEPTAWVVPVERSLALASRLGCHARAADFLELEPGGMPDDVPSYFDRIVMNPPFSNGADVRHVQHALRFACTRCVVVAVVADGPRQARAFEDWDELETLPPGTFNGTNVRARIIRKVLP